MFQAATTRYCYKGASNFEPNIIFPGHLIFLSSISYPGHSQGLNSSGYMFRKRLGLDLDINHGTFLFFIFLFELFAKIELG